MTDLTIDADEFATSLEGIVSRVGTCVEEHLPEAVQKGVRKGAALWRRGIKDKVYGDTDRTYKKHGKTYTVGAYAKSIRSHMLVKDGPKPSGEVGAPGMAGLPHLLEFGHARVGGGRVRAIPHVEDAAKEAFDYMEQYAVEAVEEALNDV